MIAKIALYLFVAVAAMQHCTRVDSTDPTMPYAAIWYGPPMSSICARLVESRDGWHARPSGYVAQTFKTKQEAVDWIEKNYCLVDAK